MENYTKIYFLFVLIFLVSCTSSRFVEPLKKNQWSVGANFGGPTLDYGVPVPLPLSSIEVGYGLDTQLTIFSGLHTTAILFGNLQLDGVCILSILKTKTIYT